jgi:monovalent cation:H+ antiporter, CPA1 family
MVVVGAFSHGRLRLVRSVDNYQVEVLLSLALVAGGHALANRLHLSGPIAMVVAGLLIGNLGRAFAMSPRTVERLDVFWELIDEVLNAVLFVLIGLVVLALTFTGRSLLAGLLAIPIVLLARLVSVGVLLAAMNRWGEFAPHTTRVLTWGGLRGGISVALALSTPPQVQGQPVAERDVLIGLTYVVVVFSILVQGLTIGLLTRRWLGGRVQRPEDGSTRSPFRPEPSLGCGILPTLCNPPRVSEAYRRPVTAVGRAAARRRERVGPVPGRG